MKPFLWIPCLLLGLATSAFPQVITLSSGTALTLPPLGGLATENSVRQADVIAGIALAGAVVDAAALERAGVDLEKQVAALTETTRTDQAHVNELTARFESLSLSYAGHLAPYEASAAAAQVDVANQRAAALASNGLAADQRSPATVARLNTWAAEIAAREVSLGQEYALLVQEHEMVETQRTAAVAFHQGADARIRATAATLRSLLAAHVAKQGVAYRQLKQCVDYAQQVAAIARRRGYNWSAGVYTTSLNTAMEQLKALSALGFN
jgi:hypothetical protein